MYVVPTMAAATTLQVVVLSLSTAYEGWSGSHPERRGDRRGGIEEGERGRGKN